MIAVLGIHWPSAADEVLCCMAQLRLSVLTCPITPNSNRNDCIWAETPWILPKTVSHVISNPLYLVLFRVLVLIDLGMRCRRYSTFCWTKNWDSCSIIAGTAFRLSSRKMPSRLEELLMSLMISCVVSKHSSLQRKVYRIMQPSWVRDHFDVCKNCSYLKILVLLWHSTFTFTQRLLHHITDREC